MTIGNTANTRVFVLEGQARGDHVPAYQSCLRMMALTQGLGDIEPIYCPSPTKYGEFNEVGSIRGAKERPTTSLEGIYAQDLLSTLFKLARQGCAFDIQLHMGLCEDPSVFNVFTKALILEGARPTNYSTEDLGALQPGDNAAIMETVDISASLAYEVVPLTLAERAGTIVTNEVLDVVICDVLSCGDCESSSDGCQKIYAITKGAGGSPSTAPDIVASIDKGATWFANDIETLSAALDPSAVDCLGDYVVVISGAAQNLSYALKSKFDAVTDPAFTAVTTGFVAGARPRDIWSTGQYAFIVGDGGYVYGCSDPTAGVTVLDAGVATVDNLNAVHGISADVAVAVGNNGAVIYTLDGVTWSAATHRPVGVGVNLNCVWVVSSLIWWVGSSAGNLYYTLDAGVTWTAKAFTGSGAGSVLDIVFSTKSVGYLAHQTSGTRGYILRTFDGGQSWVRLPEKTGSSPDNDRINALGYCDEDPNFVVGVGLGANGSDGFIVTGIGV